jgi:hypothetical protein
MSKRTNENGFPYINDGTKIEEIAMALVRHIDQQAMTNMYCKGSFEEAIEHHSEYEGLTQSEYWLALARAFWFMQQNAMERFYTLVGDREDDPSA